MTKIEQHIENSLEKFDNECYIEGSDYYTARDYVEQSQLELIEFIKREVENLPYFETEDFVFSQAFKRQDILDLLKTNKE